MTHSDFWECRCCNCLTDIAQFFCWNCGADTAGDQPPEPPSKEELARLEAEQEAEIDRLIAVDKEKSRVA